MEDSKITKYTSLGRSKEYIEELRTWAGNIDNYSFGNPDGCFPKNKIGDVVLIVKTDNFYTPYISRNWGSGGVVSQKKIKTPEELKLTPAQVIGHGKINYYNPSDEGDLELLCEDDKIRHTKAKWSAGKDYIFLPHPEMFLAFEKLIQFMPAFHYADDHQKKVKAILNLNKILYEKYKF